MNAISESHLYLNGIDGDTGQTSRWSMETGLSATNGEAVNFWDWLDRNGHGEERPRENRGTVEDIDGRNPADAGWGVIFPQNMKHHEAVAEALSQLLEYRAEQCGERFRLFHGEQGYRPGDTCESFLERQGVSADGPVDPRDGVPYYLLIVGNPGAIPFQFQHDLSVQFAVGRIFFKDLKDYAGYADSVCRSLHLKAKRVPRALFFGPEHQGDKATQLATQQLLLPLFDSLDRLKTHWQLDQAIREDATKDRFLQELRRDNPPSLVFSASHGLFYRPGHPHREQFQGSLVCSDWEPGFKGRLPKGFYVSAEDIDEHMNLNQTVLFLFACYSGGDFRKADGQGQVDPPFLSALPRRLLGRSGGGALAVVAHVERSYDCSFFDFAARQVNKTFSSVVTRLFRGYPVGHALEYINQRHAQLAVRMLRYHDYRESHIPIEPGRFLQDQKLYRDLRHYIVIGDPAVTIPNAVAS